MASVERQTRETVARVIAEVNAWAEERCELWASRGFHPWEMSIVWSADGVFTLYVGQQRVSRYEIHHENRN